MSFYWRLSCLKQCISASVADATLARALVSILVVRNIPHIPHIRRQPSPTPPTVMQEYQGKWLCLPSMCLFTPQLLSWCMSLRFLKRWVEALCIQGKTNLCVDINFIWGIGHFE